MIKDTYTREEILEALALRPCHVTGMHTPDHHTRFTCDIQRSNAFEQLLEFLGVEASELPRHLHDDCGWCHNVPTQEQYRERNREAHRWAGVPIPKELAALAPDHPKFDIPKRKVLATVKRLSKTAEEGWVGRGPIDDALELDRHAGKTRRPLEALISEGKLDESFRNNCQHVRPKGA